MAPVRSQTEKFSVLLLARTCPFPPDDGEKLRVYNLIKALADQVDITLVCRVMNAQELTGMARLETLCRGGVRGISIARPNSFFRRLVWVLPHVWSRRPLSISTVYFRDYAEAVEELTATHEFDILQVEHSILSIYCQHVRSRRMPKTVLTMHNIDHVRNARLLKNLRPGLEFFFRYIDQGRLVSWEHHALGDFDRVVAMSQLDLDCMRALRCDMRGAVVPNGVDVDGLPFGDGAPRGSQDVVFVASMDTDANHDAAMFFVEDIWPLVKAARPRARITFVGRNPRKELVMAANGDDLVVTGSVPDVVPFYRAASLAIVPLRVGGGTRLKILEAMALGVPVVSTSVGCEGLELADGEDLCMADSASGFAQAVVALLDSPTMRDRLRVNARRRVEEIYDWKVVARAQMAVYEDLAEDRRD